MSETPDWLQQYADQQGWSPPDQPAPQDVADLQQYADTFGQDMPQGPAVGGDDAQPGAGPLAQTFTEKNKSSTPTPKRLKELSEDLSDLRRSPVAASNLMGFNDPEMKAIAQDVRNDTGKTPAPNQIGAAAQQYGQALGGNADALQKPLPPPIRPNEPYPEYGPKNPQQIDPATGQPVNAKPPEESGNEPEPAQPQGHWVNGQWVRTVSPDALDMEGGLEKDRARHAEEAADRMKQNSWAQEAIYAQRSAELQAQQDAARNEQRRQAIARDKAQEDYDHAAKLATQAKVNPNVFGEGAGGTIMGALGMALGAFGASISHGPNFAQEYIQKATDNLLEAQKANAANARSGAENAWQKLKLATGSAEQADTAYRTAALQTMQSKLSELNAGPQQREALEAALGQALDTQKAKALQFRLGTEKYSPGYMVGGAPAGGAEADPEKVVQMGHESIGGYAPNTRLVFGKKDDASAVTDQMQAYGIVQKARDRIAAIEKANPVDIYRPGSEAYEDAKQIRLQAVTQVGHLNGVKKLPIFDAENMNDALDTHMYNAVTGASATHRMDTYLKNAKDALDESVQTRAPEVVRRHLDVNQRGEVTPGNHYTGENIQRAAPPPGFHVRDAGVGTREKAPLQYKPEIRHVTETPGKGKKKGSSTVTSTEPEEDEDER